MQCHNPTHVKNYAMSQPYSFKKKNAMSQSYSFKKICNVTTLLISKNMQCHNPTHLKKYRCHNPTHLKKYAMSQPYSYQKNVQCHNPTNSAMSLTCFTDVSSSVGVTIADPAEKVRYLTSMFGDKQPSRGVTGAE